MNRVKINVNPPYDVVVKSGLLQEVGSLCKPILPKTKKVFIVSDSNVSPLYHAVVRNSFLSAGFVPHTLTILAGEEYKTIDTFSKILEGAAERGFNRDDAFVALGGGVVGDLVGFASACYMRGVKFVQIPTSLLSAIDASVGGKTGVDLRCGKNLAGAFHQPVGVFFDTDVLATLPEKEYKNGLGEGLKYALLCGGRIKEIFSLGVENHLEEFCTLCVKYKGEIVEKDEKESGVRALLNLGHTVGHAIEKLSFYEISHGIAVAYGISVMANASAKTGKISNETLQEILDLIAKYDLGINPNFSAEDIASLVTVDKKIRNDGLNVIVINGFGDCSIQKMTVKEFQEYIE